MKQPKTSSPERQLSQEKALSILNGAMQEFLARGYAATSMDRIANAAGVSKATVYNHFQDKEGLFNALIQQLVEKKFPSVFSAIDTDNLQKDPRIALRQIATNMLDMSMGDEQFISFMRLIIGESERFPGLAQAFVRNVHVSSFGLLSQYFTKCSDRIKLSDPEAAARVFIGALVHYLIVQKILYGADIVPMERDRLIDSLIYFICGDKNS